MTDQQQPQQQPQQDGEIPPVAPEDPDQHKPHHDTQTTENEFNGPIDRLVTRFKRRRNFPWDRALNFFAALAVTIGTAVGVLSLRSLDRSVDEMARQTPEIIKSAKAAEDALAETKKATQLTRDSMIYGQRAWLGVAQPIQAETNFFVNDSWTPPQGGYTFPVKYSIILRVNYRNFGASPALRVFTSVGLSNGFEDVDGAMTRACSEADSGRSTIYLSTDLRPMNATGDTQGMTLFPSHDLTFSFRGDARLTRRAYTAEPVFVVGCIRYVDIFGASRRTRFCYHTMTSAGTTGKQSPMRQCWMLNDAE
jgi:hypothetical protein